MTTQIIDASLHVASFPATYTGPGTLIGNCIQSGGDETDLHGYFTGAGNAVQINLGFMPLHAKVVDVTGVIVWEWMYGFPATDTLKTVTAGTLTVDATSAIVATDQSGLTNIDGNWILTLSAALCVSTHVVAFHIEG